MISNLEESLLQVTKMIDKNKKSIMKKEKNDNSKNKKVILNKVAAE